jgi:hypothetical protein
VESEKQQQPLTQLVSISSDGTVGVWNSSSVPSGNVFDVVCALLPDHDLESALAGYPIRVNDPICAGGYDPPLPEWMTRSLNGATAHSISGHLSR